MTETALNHEVPARVALEGVPAVGFASPPGRDPELTPFPACLRAALEFLGEDYGYRVFAWQGTMWRQSNLYTYLMGVTGAAFRLHWAPGWAPDNSHLLYLADDPAAAFARAFAAVGYDYQYLGQTAEAGEAAFRRHVLESLYFDRRPVLAFGVVGPPECCLVTGYDDEGDTLLGWSFFQETPPFNQGLSYERTGQFRQRRWYSQTPGLVLIGPRCERPPVSEVYRQALAWAIQVARTPRVWGQRASGLAAYTAWAAALVDEACPRAQAAAHLTAVNDAATVVAEGRWYAAHFLRQIAALQPAAGEPLEAAAEAYAAEHTLMWEVWRELGGPGLGDTQLNHIAQPACRQLIAALIREAHALDERAVGQLEAALALVDRADRHARQPDV